MNKTVLAIALAATLTLSGCGAMSTAINNRDLEVSSKMSESIFLDPVPRDKKTIYVQVRNTTSEKMPALKESLKAELVNEGWRVVDDLDQAHDMVQVNVLQAGEADSPESVWDGLTGGYGSSLALGGLAGLAMASHKNNVGNGLGAGLLVGAGSWVADQMVKNVTYSVITDVQISTHTKGKVKHSSQANMSQGSSGSTEQHYDQEDNWLRYRTRIASVANKMNLEFDEARPALTQQLATEVAGIFAG